MDSRSLAVRLGSLLRRVDRPGRYVGGEFGAIWREDAALRVALSYPDLYEIGMSNTAIKILYALLNGIADVSCERVFAVAPDMEAALRAAGEPLYSLETGRPLHQFHILGFSLGYELTLTNLLAIIDLGGVPILREERAEKDPIILVGGPAASNPAPLGLLADCVFIGEAEGWAELAFGELARMKRRGARRQDLLSWLCAQPSIWYPGRREVVRRALWRGFTSRQASTAMPVPSIRVVQDHGVVEIMRGCPNACRFCHATIYYRPCRLKPIGMIQDEVRDLVRLAGYRQVTLSSLSSGDYRGIHDLVRSLNTLYAPQKVSFSLPSLRVDSLGLSLLAQVSEVRKSGLTFAVETANPDWQREVRKPASLAKTIAILREARGQGWRSAKFYFMVGLPPSFEEDEPGAILSFLRAVRSATGMSLNVNIAGFIPKPHTPWERAPQIGEQAATQRIMAVRDGLRGDGFKIGYHAPFLSLLEGVVSRGDARAGRLVLDAYRRGARLDAWEEHVNIELWREAIAAAHWDVMGETCRARQPGEALPWEGIALGTSTSAIEDYRPSDQTPTGARGIPALAPASPTSGPWLRVIFSFEKKGPPVFIAHLDLMTVFERALLRAGYAARFTEGFNPKPRLEFASPLGLGVESLEEIAAVDLLDFDSPTPFVERMNAALPAGLTLRSAAVVPEPAPTRNPARRKSLMSLYWGSDYRVDGPAGDSRELRLAATQPSIRATLTAAGTWESSRVTRLRTLARGPAGLPASYFEVLGPAAGAGG